MNPQMPSPSLLVAADRVRLMRGGVQSHMLPTSDGHAYVVKFPNNPQSLCVLANEWLACSIGRAVGLTIPEPAILYVPAKLVESSPSLVIQISELFGPLSLVVNIEIVIALLPKLGGASDQWSRYTL